MRLAFIKYSALIYLNGKFYCSILLLYCCISVQVAVYVDDPSDRYTVSVLLMSNGYTATVIKNTRT